MLRVSENTHKTYNLYQIVNSISILVQLNCAKIKHKLLTNIALRYNILLPYYEKSEDTF